jgi:calcineurin-like phosphoesterase family protein
MIYITGDWHLNHENINKLDNRPDDWLFKLESKLQSLRWDDILIFGEVIND